jgi:dTDP-D-glucose 4,6-dehydratase
MDLQNKRVLVTGADEGHPLRAQSPYSASKIGADAIATSFHYSFRLPLIIARPFNVYENDGGDDVPS